MDFKALIGKTLSGRYEILSLAGSGGMGTVFKARQTELDRLVAIKILDANLISGDDSAIRFEREAKSLSLLSHAHIAGFYSYGLFDEKFPYIVMEFIEGKSLAQELAELDSLPVDRVLRIAEQTADAMAFAHQAGIIHRDLKPQNILLQDFPEKDYVKVVDFGLSALEPTDKSGSAEGRLTKTGILMGTPSYLSPEQCMGHRADARSDIYALACIIYQMICSEPPFIAENPVALIHMHAHEPVQRLSQRCKQKLPAGLASIVMKCLEKDPEKRYQTMELLRDDLRKILAGNLPSTAAENKDPFKLKRVLRTLAFGLGVSLLLVMAGFALFYSTESGRTLQSRLSLKQDPGAENLYELLNRAVSLSQSGDDAAAYRLKEGLDQELSQAVPRRKESANLRLELAQRFYKNENYNMAVLIAYDSLSELELARKEKLLDSTFVAMLSKTTTSLRKLKLRSLKPAKIYSNPVELENRRALADGLIAAALVLSDKLDEASFYVNDLAAIYERLSKQKQFDFNGHNVAMMLVAMLDTKWDHKMLFEQRAPRYQKCQIMARRLVEVGVPGGDDLLWRQRIISRGYIGIGDFVGAEREAKKWLTMLSPGTAAYEEVELALAGVQEVLGKPELSMKLLKELIAQYGEADALRRLARGQVWAGQNIKGCQTLDLAMSKLKKQGLSDHNVECAILEDYAWSWGDAGDNARAEPYLRKLVELQSQYSKASPGYTKAVNQLAKCLDSQNKLDESMGIEMANPIGAGVLSQGKKGN